ncbi:MAG: hypothetical protein Ct9H90mP20_0560 [Candidatus Neomarinimicrobiota bacterium]|nr:MAG: hypothetical protein Ct9H90mP20_0560 [Candidatus Neomarinimicrobiota bacterium]
MTIIDTIKVDARTVNDVKISEDGRVGIISREGHLIVKMDWLFLM